MRSEIDVQVRVDIMEVLTGQPLILYGEGETVLAKSMGAQ